MSSSPVFEPNPYVARTTPMIERANRLLHMRAHPGYLDIIRLGQELVDKTAAVLRDYPGWDPQQITLLKARYQAAFEYHQELFRSIDGAIEAGVAEAKEDADDYRHSVADIVDTSDLVRQKALQKFESMETENRVAGSF